MVREPRRLLAEMGCDGCPSDAEVRVWDSSAELRYLVLPQRPPGTESLGEEQLAELVSRDSMIGVEALVTKPPTDLLLAPSEIREMAGPAALPRVNGELVYESPWQRRAFGTAVATTWHLGLDWDQFRVRLMAAIADQPDRPYYESWVAAS